MPASAAVQAGRVAFTGLHFRQHAVHHQPAAVKLHIEMALAEHPAGRLSNHRESLDHQRLLQSLAMQLRAQLGQYDVEGFVAAVL
jgi:hypothetical protein